MPHIADPLSAAAASSRATSWAHFIINTVGFSFRKGHLRLPAIYDLHADPFERANKESIGYDAWRIERLYLLVPAQAFVANWLASFKEFPPRQKPASFNLDQVMQTIQEGATGFR
jgi:hypothetical protein